MRSESEMNLREAAQQALEALELAGMSHDVMLMSDPPQDAWKARGVSWKLAQAMTALRAALADTQDWNEIEALRESLREHMAEIQRLRAALAEDAMQRLTDVQQEMKRKPLTNDEIVKIERSLRQFYKRLSFHKITRAIERAHGIGDEK